MQGRQGAGGDSAGQPPKRRSASVNGTGKSHTTPKRLSDTDTGPQPIPRRASRKTHKALAKKRARGGCFIASILLVCAVIVLIIVGIVNLAKGIGTSSQPSLVVTDFFTALSESNYTQAYKDLAPTISQSQFTQQAQAADHCYGAVTNYQEVADTAKNEGNTQSYAYDVTRKNSAQPYRVQITLQLQQDNTWKISSYGSSLGPQAPACQ